MGVQGEYIHGFSLSTSRWPAIAQSIWFVLLSMRRSTYQLPTDMTIVSVVSKAGSGSHRREIRVDMRLDEGDILDIILGGLITDCVRGMCCGQVNE